MAEEFITRDEFNGLGAKVSNLSEGCIACRTTLTADVRHLSEELKETKKDVSDIKQMIQRMGEQVQALTLKVSIIVAVMVALGNLASPLLKNLLGK